MTDSERNFSLDSFKKATAAMVATNDNAYNGRYWSSNLQHVERIREYAPDEIDRIINSGSLQEQQKLSRNYFYKDGYYKRIIIYYATLLKYVGILIPNPSFGKDLSTSHIQKRYYNALDFVEKMSLPTLFTNCAQRALVDGCYYGVVVKIDKQNFSVLDLPSGYCCSRFKDFAGNDIIEFDVSYFNSIVDETARKTALSVYPKVISSAYKKWLKGELDSKWVMIPADVGICFPFFDGRPLFLSMIPATIDYDKAVDTELERDAEEIRKILVQKIPHLNDGRLVFEPDEAEEMHIGAVGMLKANKNISVLTTYADVDSVVSKTSNDSAASTLDRIEQNIYSQTGVSSEIFSSTGSSTLETSIKNDMALMMYIAEKFSNFVTNVLNSLYSNSNINFKYQILPITYYNDEKYIDSTYKLAKAGYSLLMPALALGISQRDLCNIKDLENKVLKLEDKLIIPNQNEKTSTSTSTSSSSSGAAPDGEGYDNPGRPKLEEEEKSEKTLENEKSLDNQV